MGGIWENPRDSLPKNPTFLLVEGNHCFGNTAQTAADDLKKAFPSCKIIYAVDHMDYSYQKLNGAEALFYGQLTNECRELSEKEAKAKGIKNELSLFPWEDIEEEYAGVSCRPFDYGSELKRETKLEIDLEKE